MTIVPAGPRLAVVDLPAEDESKLILPMGVAGRPYIGIVVEVGTGIHFDVDKGDKVFYRCKGDEIETVKIIDASCVLAIDNGDGE